MRLSDLEDSVPAAPKAMRLSDIEADILPSQKISKSWSDVGKSAIGNVGSSAVNYGHNIYQAVRHPLDTLGGTMDVLAGGLGKAEKKVGEFVPDWLSEAWKTGNVDISQESRMDMEKRQARQDAAADAFGQMQKERLGSVEAIKNTIATDPVGFIGDISTVLTGGSALAKTVGMPKTAGVIQSAANYTNPISAVAPIARGLGKTVAFPTKYVLGVATQVGPETISQAAKAGYAGKPAFFENLTRKANMTDVLDEAKFGLQKMGESKSMAYRANMAKVSGDKSVLNFDGIDASVSDAFKMTTFKGQVKNQRAFDVTKNIYDEVSNWKTLNPKTFHTPEGLDALKQKVGGMLEGIPFEEKTARLAAGKIYNSIKSEIVKQAPVYADTMKAYADASDQIKEIERALSLGNRASADTGMRKLQSLMRNNANTNYGNRLDLAKTLEKEGGVDIMPALSGQAMSSWVPRGLAGQMETMGTLGASILASNPLIALALPFQSPKAVGATLYGGGKAARGVTNAFKKSGLSSQQAKTLSLLLSQAGRQGTGITSYQNAFNGNQ